MYAMNVTVNHDNLTTSAEQVELDDEESDDYLPLVIDNNEAVENGGNIEQATPIAPHSNATEKWSMSIPPPWIDGDSNNSFVNADRSCGGRNSARIHPLTFLHNEIVSFVQLIEPLPGEVEHRELLVCRIRATVQKYFPDGTRVEIFGSQATGLFLPTSDIDLVVISPNNNIVANSEGHEVESSKTNSTSKNQRRKERQNAEELKKNENGNEIESQNNYETHDQDEEGDYMLTSKTNLHRFAQALRKDWGVSELSYLEIIENTRIPLVKFTHSSTNISVDVSFDQPSGPPAAQLMKRYLEALPPLRPLTFVLKYFLAARNLNEPYTGGVGSFLLQLMIVAFLQHRERDALNYQRPSVYNLGSLLLEFLELYGINFNYFTTGISVRYDGFFFPKGASDRRANFWKPDRGAMVSIYE
jgi:non-canonical poly(A) RNA polymerase PAPD5/7